MKVFTKVFAIACLLSIMTVQAQAQEKKSEKGWVSGLSFSSAFPVGNMERYSYGFGLYSNFDYNFNKNFSARFDLGWNDFSGPETTFIDNKGKTHTDQPNMSVWEFTAGLRAKISVIYIEARGGYFTGVNSWGVVPAVGLRFGKFDIQGNFSIAGDYHWGGARISYYFGKM